MCQPGSLCMLFPLKDSCRALGTGLADCSQHSLLTPLPSWYSGIWNVFWRRLGPGLSSAAALVLQTRFGPVPEQSIPGEGPGLAKMRAVA